MMKSTEQVDASPPPVLLSTSINAVISEFKCYEGTKTMTWKRKAYLVAAALDGRVSQWWPMSRQTFASVVVQTDDGLFHGRYSKCDYLSLGNNISSTYSGAMDITVGKDGEGTDRFEVVYNHPPREDARRILTAFVRLKHPDFNLEQVLAVLPISSHERLEWMLELSSRDLKAK